MLTYLALAFAGLVALTFFIYPNPNTHVRTYRFKLAVQRNILVLANFAMLPLLVFVAYLVYSIITLGVGKPAIDAAFTGMFSLWYIYALFITISVLLSFKLTEVIGNQIGKMKKGGNSLFKGAVLGPANLQQDVADMCRYLRIKNVPKLYILPSDGPPNAFAIGVHNGHSAVAVHGSLVTGLTQDELHAVIAHELGHIAAGDMHARILGFLVDFTRFALAGCMLFMMPSFLLGLISIWLAYVVVRTIDTFLDLGLSRRAEFNADAVAVEIQQTGVPMSNALLKLEAMMLAEAPVMAEKSKRMSRWLKTHPPTAERVNAARKLRAK